jgi:hypothetical protein
MLCTLLLGSFYTYSRQPKYLYTTTIAIGSHISDDGAVIFESTQTVKNKIEKSFIPQILYQYAENTPNAAIINIKVAVPKRSQVLILTSKAKAKHGETVKMLQQRIVDMLSKDHQHIHNSIKFGYERQVSLSKIELDFLQNDAVINAENKKNQSQLIDIETTYKRLKDPNLTALKREKLVNKIQNTRDSLKYLIDLHKKLNNDLANLKVAKYDLQTKIQEINTQVTQSLANREHAINNVNLPTQAMTMLMIDNKIQQSQRFIINLENQLNTEIIERISNLAVAIKKNKRQQGAAKKMIVQAEMQLNNFEFEQQLNSEPTRAKIDSLTANINLLKVQRQRKITEQKQVIKEMQLRLGNLKPTRSVTPPMQSLKAQGIGLMKTMVLSLVFGLFLGLSMVFLLEFLEKVKQRNHCI